MTDLEHDGRGSDPIRSDYTLTAGIVMRVFARLRRGAAGLAVSFLVLAGASGAPAAAPFEAETFVLANGLEVVVIPNRRAPIATQMVWYKVGAADEPPGKSGIAHFLEHLMFRGTTTMAPGQYSAEIARIGGNENASTSSDYTIYHQTVAVEHLELAMRLEADRMVNLVLTDAVVLPERDVILEERRQRIDNEPASQLGEAMSAALYRHHSYGTPTIGWEHEMRGLTSADAIDFYRRWYRPNNAILIVAGDVEAAAVRKLAETYYGPIPRGAVPARERLVEPPHLAPVQVMFKSPRVQQPNWVRRYLAPSSGKDPNGHAHALELLAEIVAGGPTSRFYRRLVVEDKVAAGVNAYYEPDRIDEGSFAISASPPVGGSAEAVGEAVEAAIGELLRDGVNAAELATAKTLLVADAIKARDSLTGPPRIVGAALATGGTLDDVEEWPARIRAVTIEQVNAAARYVLRPESSVTGLLLAAPGS